MAFKPLIAPSILSADFAHLADQIAEAEQFGADWLHIDVMDGHFVPNLSMGAQIVAACRRVSELPLDVHMMIEKPENFLDAFAEAGADHITVHAEACEDLPQILDSIHSLGCKAGVSIKPATPAAALESALGTADILLVMSVEPGFSGQAFMPEVLPKVAALRASLDALQSKALIEIDGGIDAHTLPLALQAGVNVFVAGSAIFKHPEGIAAGMESLQGAIMEKQQ
ncbi:MAG: ribulose-phosphate 3-epimerase [Chloroflexi bacterium]|nr:ribulose-phosphate 3-epimerase [Chloroflexota bacterium]MQC26012.1 ribulose-phosphate 3-epimerase [Chloroflexota bacterium]